jgi:hypothetical protein
LILFWSGRVGSGQVRSDDVDSDNRANSAQFQAKLPDGAELGNIKSGISQQILILN